MYAAAGGASLAGRKVNINITYMIPQLVVCYHLYDSTTSSKLTLSYSSVGSRSA